MLTAKLIVNPSLAGSSWMILGCGQLTKLIIHHDDIILQGKGPKPGEVVNVSPRLHSETAYYGNGFSCSGIINIVYIILIVVN